MYESIKAVEIDILIVFNLVFRSNAIYYASYLVLVNNTTLLYFFFFTLIIDCYFLIPAVIAKNL